MVPVDPGKDEHFDDVGLFLQEIQDGKNKQENQSSGGWQRTGFP